MILWTVACQAPLSIGFSGMKTEWAAISSSGDLTNPGVEPGSSALAFRIFTTEPPGNPKCILSFGHYLILTFMKFEGEGESEVLLAPY